jgi:hypothetical protein
MEQAVDDLIKIAKDKLPGSTIILIKGKMKPVLNYDGDGKTTISIPPGGEIIVIPPMKK